MTFIFLEFRALIYVDYIFDSALLVTVVDFVEVYFNI